MDPSLKRIDCLTKPKRKILFNRMYFKKSKTFSRSIDTEKLYREKDGCGEKKRCYGSIPVSTLILLIHSNNQYGRTDLGYSDVSIRLLYYEYKIVPVTVSVHIRVTEDFVLKR